MKVYGKTVAGLGPKVEYQVCIVGFLSGYVFDLHYGLIQCFDFSKSYNDFSFQKSTLLVDRG